MAIIPTPLYSQFSQLLAAVNNCQISGAEHYETIHEQSIDMLISECLPHGSGIDSDIEFDYSESTPEKLVFCFQFHHMNEDGFYTHWSAWKMTITPSLQWGKTIDITSTTEEQSEEQSDDGIVDFLHDTFNLALSAMVWQTKDSEWHSSIFESVPNSLTPLHTTPKDLTP